MMNFVNLVGTIVELPEEVKIGNGMKTMMTLRVERPFQESSGVYLSDDLPVEVWAGIAERTKETCSMGDVVAIKGRLKTFMPENQNMPGTMIEVVAEHVFLLTPRIIARYKKQHNIVD